MNIHAAFLEDIIANPTDDTPRLIYADWLEEHGDESERARAEYIRKSCWLYCWAKNPGERVYYPPTGEWIDGGLAGRCLAEIQTLEKHHAQGWLAGSPFLVPECGNIRWQRGFVALLRCHWSVWETRGPAVVAATPLEGVHIVDRSPLSVGRGGARYMWAFGVPASPYILPACLISYFNKRQRRRIEISGPAKPQLCFAKLEHAFEALDNAALLWAQDVAAAERISKGRR